MFSLEKDWWEGNQYQSLRMLQGVGVESLILSLEGQSAWWNQSPICHKGRGHIMYEGDLMSSTKGLSMWIIESVGTSMK